MSGYIKGEWAKRFESKFKMQKDGDILILMLNKDTSIAVNIPEIYEKYEKEASHLNCENLLYHAEYILTMRNIFDVLYYLARDELVDAIYESSSLNIKRLPWYFSSLQKTLSNPTELLELYDISVKFKLVKLEALIILANLLKDEILKYINNLNFCFYSYINININNNRKPSNSVKRTFEFLFDVPGDSKNKKRFLDWVGRREPIRIIRNTEGENREVFYDSEEDDLSEDDMQNKRIKTN